MGTSREPGSGSAGFVEIRSSFAGFGVGRRRVGPVGARLGKRERSDGVGVSGHRRRARLARLEDGLDRGVAGDGDAPLAELAAVRAVAPGEEGGGGAEVAEAAGAQLAVEPVGGLELRPLVGLVLAELHHPAVGRAVAVAAVGVVVAGQPRPEGEEGRRQEGEEEPGGGQPDRGPARWSDVTHR